MAFFKHHRVIGSITFAAIVGRSGRVYADALAKEHRVSCRRPGAFAVVCARTVRHDRLDSCSFDDPPTP
eukprot:CAMPEP_0174327152 /NCGR_PEP_ID=MMETSP0810-20121108/14350_1 /TAXON_ID=73025 ORGANISM="Eutreptiella gymnastica-like, Strain CCMP1594" /NCGR_SAMPLE_ID=MMETSP0810 /ASSEMBLY_ACC=CAM_ASM_000659 /LENGTH=68 /DNA_ID=CAMNT_0015440951 /DNA_START=790 /DNA_END=992 /DNA_ORIENTATION=+